VTQDDRTRERLIATYRKKARHYDVTSRLYPAPGYPQRTQRLRAVRALGLRAGDTVIDMACGTGLNFPLLEKVVGPDGRIVGVDLTDAMLARAQDRIAANGWSNISLVQADAADFDFPTEVAAILSTYAMSQVPECAEVIAHGAAALSAGGRWVVLDLKVPGNTPRWLAQFGTAMVRPFASIDEWLLRRPWEAIRAAMQEELADLAWAELCFGTAFLAAGSRGRPADVYPEPPGRELCALARVMIFEAPGNRSGRPTTTLPVSWSPARAAAAPVPRAAPAVGSCVDLPRSAGRLGVWSNGPASARDVPRPIGRPVWHAAAAVVPGIRRRSFWLEQASARRALAVPSRRSRDASASARTSSLCCRGPSARSRGPPGAAA
jgi:demethylmenaquinone methyltransferase/2-methoxy-6-polyprenyl-1,4-benzoquinol methylase